MEKMVEAENQREMCKKSCNSQTSIPKLLSVLIFNKHFVFFPFAEEGVFLQLKKYVASS